MSNEKTCTIPWHDGTDREVEVGTACETKSGFIRYASEGGYQTNRGESNEVWPWGSRKVVRIFTEAPEPPVKVNVPTGLGAIVSLPDPPHNPCYVLTRGGWLGLSLRFECDPDGIANMLRDGARVLFEGVDKDTP